MLGGGGGEGGVEGGVVAGGELDVVDFDRGAVGVLGEGFQVAGKGFCGEAESVSGSVGAATGRRRATRDDGEVGLRACWRIISARAATACSDTAKPRSASEVAETGTG